MPGQKPQSLEKHETLRYTPGTRSRRPAKNAGLRRPWIETQHRYGTRKLTLLLNVAFGVFTFTGPVVAP
jgi:hypothetical protein